MSNMESTTQVNSGTTSSMKENYETMKESVHRNYRKHKKTIIVVVVILILIILILLYMLCEKSNTSMTESSMNLTSTPPSYKE